MSKYSARSRFGNKQKSRHTEAFASIKLNNSHKWYAQVLQEENAAVHHRIKNFAVRIKVSPSVEIWLPNLRSCVTVHA